jgi:hypothetical protein
MNEPSPITSLKALRDAEAACARCPPYRDATQVFPGGPAGAKPMMVAGQLGGPGGSRGASPTHCGPEDKQTELLEFKKSGEVNPDPLCGCVLRDFEIPPPIAASNSGRPGRPADPEGVALTTFVVQMPYHSAPRARTIAGLSGFFTLEPISRWAELTRRREPLEAMPSSPVRQA